MALEKVHQLCVVHVATHLTLLLQQTEDAIGLAFEQVEALHVVSKLNLLPWNVLIYVRLLLGAKEKVDKLLVKLLVCVVDTQLLEAVVFKHLEPEDVEHADAALRLRWVLHALVDAVHQPVEEQAVQVLGQRVPRVQALLQVERNLVHRRLPRRPPRRHGAKAKRLLQLLGLAVQQQGHPVQIARGGGVDVRLPGALVAHKA
mmetsp:Transcript_9650/g.18160  ORF Transcript_9650/g.18160 Transcript_9650/m.18160 type:complete len:202 (+) Transcript_9650:3068-3673(+)